LLTAGKDDEGKPWTSRYPIIAWRISENCVEPISNQGYNFDQEISTGGILYPDGRVEQMGVTTYDSETKWRAAVDRDFVDYVAETATTST
jgi:hypothetical protein